jgi:uncharacterized membrane protein YeaQ/YmgE (transglycosylase-associated protein family)
MSTTAVLAIVGAVIAAVFAVVVLGAVLKLVWWLAVGLLIGALARWALPGRQEMGLLATMAFGVGGSFIGGIVASLLHLGTILGFVASVACAAGLVVAFGRHKSLPPQ